MIGFAGIGDGLSHHHADRPVQGGRRAVMDMPSPGTGAIKIDKIGAIRLDMEIPGNQGNPVNGMMRRSNGLGHIDFDRLKENGICRARCAV